MARTQKAKGKKRPASWHASGKHGRGKWLARLLDSWPDTGVDADPTTGAPQPLRRRGSKNVGDAL